MLIRSFSSAALVGCFFAMQVHAGNPTPPAGPTQPVGKDQQQTQPMGKDQQPVSKDQQQTQPVGKDQQQVQPVGKDQSPISKDQQQVQPAGKDQSQPVGKDQQQTQPLSKDQQQVQPVGKDQQQAQPVSKAQQQTQPVSKDQQPLKGQAPVLGKDQKPVQQGQQAVNGQQPATNGHTFGGQQQGTQQQAQQQQQQQQVQQTQQSQQGSQKPVQQCEAQVGYLRVIVPSHDAVVYLDDYQTQGMGMDRMFVTPALDVCRKFSYNLTVDSCGRRWQMPVQVKGGETVTINMLQMR